MVDGADDFSGGLVLDGADNVNVSIGSIGGSSDFSPMAKSGDFSKMFKKDMKTQR